MCIYKCNEDSWFQMHVNVLVYGLCNFVFLTEAFLWVSLSTTMVKPKPKMKGFDLNQHQSIARGTRYILLLQIIEVPFFIDCDGEYLTHHTRFMLVQNIYFLPHMTIMWAHNVSVNSKNLVHNSDLR